MEVKDPQENVPLLDKKFNDRSSNRPGTGVGVPARYIFTFLSFLACFNLFCLRTCLCVALVAMVNSTALSIDDYANNDSDISGDCPGAEESRHTSRKYEEGEFIWDEKTQSVILGVFYYAYAISQVTGGWLSSNRMSAKRMLALSILTSSLLNLAIPFAARAGGSSYVIAVKGLQGLVEGPAFPFLHSLCSRWVPAHERSKLMSFIHSGCQMGIVCGMLITGLLCRYGFGGGWPSAFYVFGILGCVWFILWMTLVYESPAHHPRISESERCFIEDSLQQREGVSAPIPWRKLLTSAPVWGICIAFFSYMWGYNSLMICLPTYMKQILHFDIVADGFLSALPYLLMWLTQVLAGIVADFTRRYISTGSTRKLWFTIGSACPACFLIGTGYVDCDHTLTVVLLTLGVSVNGIAASAVIVNNLDFAPKFAGLVCAMANAVGSITGFLGPSIVGILTYHNQTVTQWRKFFYLTAAIYAACMLSFLWLGRGEVQSWAAPAPQSTSIPTPLVRKETQCPCQL